MACTPSLRPPAQRTELPRPPTHLLPCILLSTLLTAQPRPRRDRTSVASAEKPRTVSGRSMRNKAGRQPKVSTLHQISHPPPFNPSTPPPLRPSLEEDTAAMIPSLPSHPVGHASAHCWFGRTRVHARASATGCGTAFSAWLRAALRALLGTNSQAQPHPPDANDPLDSSGSLQKKRWDYCNHRNTTSAGTFESPGHRNKPPRERAVRSFKSSVASTPVQLGHSVRLRHHTREPKANVLTHPDIPISRQRSNSFQLPSVKSLRASPPQHPTGVPRHAHHSLIPFIQATPRLRAIPSQKLPPPWLR